ncbi:hypothetical protein [Mitsuaria sp. 7]|uniref:hypothetical protein n=1 Tax=Mitsuaria sp. 7 TaxID=1658665 RepID=UPI0007DDC883|nr:hypothetical protein [Mitsuaria sp. 7]ANH67141.1 hypothetical protein ABE85_05350 [Mitsuaria sp. 7]
MRIAHRSIVVSPLPVGQGQPLLRGALLALAICAAGTSVRAEGQYPSAQDMVAMIEVVAVECVRQDHLKIEDVNQMRRNLPRHLHRATYAQYLASPAYERSAAAFRADIAKDGVTKKFCERLRDLRTVEPNDIIFAERGLDYPDRPER